jgi:hypothetical protein
VPPLDWIVPLHSDARAAGLRIYYARNCGMDDDLRVREFPWDEPKEKCLPESLRYLKDM